MRSMLTSSSRCIRASALPTTFRRWAGWSILCATLVAVAGCSDGSYAARAERYLGAVTTAAVESLRSLEENGDLDQALDRYAREIREAELFLHGQSGYARQASYQKFAALVASHKELLATLRERGTSPGAAANAEAEDGSPAASAPAPWVQRVNQLLRETSEVRSLLRQGS